MSSSHRYGIAEGQIPTSLTVVLKTAVEYDTPAGKIKAQAAFVTDTATESSLEVAKTWANRNPGATDSPRIVTIPNDPILGLRILDLDVRCEGGRAWKVLTPEGWYVDLREDVILDIIRARTLIETHLDGGFYVAGPFRWVKFGTQMRLALMDSDLYREIEVSNKLKNTTKIGIRDLVPGEVYLGRKQDKALVFVGHVRFKGKKCQAWINLHGGRGSPKNFLEMTDADFQEIYNKDQKGYYFVMDVTTSPSVTTQIGKVHLPANPAKWFDYSGCYIQEVDTIATEAAKQRLVRLGARYSSWPNSVYKDVLKYPLEWL